MYSYLLKTIKSKELAEEATLDVFLKIWNARQALHEIINFEAFLFRVVHNKALDYIRKAKTNRLMQQEIWVGLEMLAATETADQKILHADAEAAIHTAISHLPPQRKEAFRLSREENLSYDAIAKKMKISRNTVRNHVSAALQFIRGHLHNGPEMATLIMLTLRMY
jgi:RNA polymerase sigma-70 factor (family 1)